MQTFGKEERLCSKILFNKLVEKGNSFTVYPFKTIWLEADFKSSKPVQIAISVPKKRFKRAVDRNRIKRLTREAYRKNKEVLYEALQGKPKIILLLIWLSPEILEYREVEEKIKALLQRLIKLNESARISQESI